MNPKPFESLNHFTVPVAMSFHSCLARGYPSFAAGTMIKGGNRLALEPLLAARLARSLLVSCGPHSSTHAQSVRTRPDLPRTCSVGRRLGRDERFRGNRRLRRSVLQALASRRKEGD